MARTGSYTPDDFDRLVRPVIGLPVSHTWKGYGSASFLELGQLSETFSIIRSGERLQPKGEATIWIEWEWRVERGSKVLFGSSDSGPTIMRRMTDLETLRIASLALEGSVPELVVGFSNGDFLRTMVATAGDPVWSIMLPDQKSLQAKEGMLRYDDGRPKELSPAEREEINFAEETEKRWGRLGTEHDLGRCLDCHWFVSLDSDSRLRSYGACTAKNGQFDGQVLHERCGCDAFENRANNFR